MIPLWLIVCVLAVNGGIQLYLECRDSVAALESEESMDVVQLFYICNGIGDIIGDGDSLY